MSEVRRLQFEDPLQVGFISTYPPTECGLATFTYDLVQAVAKQGWKSLVVSVDHAVRIPSRDPRVICQVRRESPEDYLEAAYLLNDSGVRVVCLQHEYGIFGGSMGSRVLTLLRALKVPVVTTLHTVVPHPTPEMKSILQEVVLRSAAVVVMARTAIPLLRDSYGLPTQQVQVIPHGTHFNPLLSRAEAKALLGLHDRPVLSTFGLLSRGKGIEDVIRAMPTILERFPNTVYLVLGETHPKVRTQEGETYREFLQAEVKRLKLQNHVRFVNHYLPLDQVLSYLRATDIYLTPYHNPNQITSGTLAYALSAGCAVVSTPYLYAWELLEGGGGVFTEFRSPESIGQAVIQLLSHPEHLLFHQTLAVRRGRAFRWEQVGVQYARLFSRVSHYALVQPMVPAYQKREVLP